MHTATSALTRKRITFWSAVFIAYAFAAAYAAQGDLRGDEYVHFEQIHRYLHGDFHLIPDSITTIPGYHLLIAGLMWLIGADSLGAARVISAFSGFCLLLGFHRLRRDALGRDDFLATAQLAVLPILLPFVFLVYTDVLSVALVVWAAWAATNRRHWLAVLIVFAALAVRQNNIIWVGLLAWIAIRESDAGPPPPNLRTLLRALPHALPYALPMLAFCAYWIWNGSISVSAAQAQMHPDLSLHSGNIFYFMFIAALLFPFDCAASWSRCVSAVRTRPWLLAVPLVIAALYFLTFKVDHPYNVGTAVALRNRILLATTYSQLWYAAFGAIALFGAIGVLGKTLLRSDAWVLWLTIFVFLSVSWLIEQRYYLIPFALYMAWRKPGPRWTEWATVALWTPIAVLFFYGFISGRLYL